MEHSLTRPAVRGIDRESWASIPDVEQQQLLLAYSDAVQRADEGWPSLGQAVLIRGLNRAEIALMDGKPWAGELIRYWREAIDRYCERYSSDEEE